MYGIYANIWGILMGSMLPYIAAPWILWVLIRSIFGFSQLWPLRMKGGPAVFPASTPGHLQGRLPCVQGTECTHDYSHQSSRHPPKKIETLQLITSDSLVGMDFSSFFLGVSIKFFCWFQEHIWCNDDEAVGLGPPWHPWDTPCLIISSSTWFWGKEIHNINVYDIWLCGYMA